MSPHLQCTIPFQQDSLLKICWVWFNIVGPYGPYGVHIVSTKHVEKRDMTSRGFPWRAVAIHLRSLFGSEVLSPTRWHGPSKKRPSLSPKRGLLWGTGAGLVRLVGMVGLVGMGTSKVFFQYFNVWGLELFNQAQCPRKGYEGLCVVPDSHTARSSCFMENLLSVGENQLQFFQDFLRMETGSFTFQPPGPGPQLAVGCLQTKLFSKLSP